MNHNDQTASVVAQMYHMMEKYVDDARVFPTAEKLFNFVRTIPYVRDIDKCGTDECLQRPRYGMQSGDCDDKSIVAGASLSKMGIPFRLVTTSYKRYADMQHVYLEIQDGERWIPFDATYAQNKFGYERPYWRKLVWKNPMRLISHDGFSTLEGLSGPLDPAIDASISIASGELASWTNYLNTTGAKAINDPNFNVTQIAKDGVVSEVKKYAAQSITSAIGLTSIGGPIGIIAGALIAGVIAAIGVSGKTQHLSVQQADSEARKISNSIGALYKSLPESGRREVERLAQNYFDAIWKNLGDEWKERDDGHFDGRFKGMGLLKRLIAGYNKTNNVVRGGVRTQAMVDVVEDQFFFPLYTVYRGMDAARIKETSPQYVTDPLKEHFYDPYKKYLQKVIETVTPGGGPGGSTAEVVGRKLLDTVATIKPMQAAVAVLILGAVVGLAIRGKKQ